MKEKEINEKLAEAMNINVASIDYKNGTAVCRAVLKPGEREMVYFDYKDPAIFVENVEWLLDNGYIDLWDGLMLKYKHINNVNKGGEAIHEINIVAGNKRKAAALARIEASKEKDNDRTA